MLSLLNTTFTNAVRKGFTLVGSLLSKLRSRSAYFENKNCTKATLQDLDDVNLLEKASIVTTPTAYSDGKLHSVKPVQTFGNELVVNGSFDTDSDWTKGTGWSIANGKASRTAQSGSTACDQNISIIAGRTYKIVYDLTITSGSFFVRLAGTTNVSGTSRTISGTYTDYLTAATGNNKIRLVGENGSFIGSIDNVSVKEVIDADFDFQRGSAATRVNSQGLIENVQTLSGNLVQNGDFSEIGSELVTNGSFDTDSDWNKGAGWSISEGKANCDGTQTATTNFFQSNVINDQSKTYKVEFTLSNYVSGSVKSKISNDAQGVNRTANGTYVSYLSGMTNTQLNFTASSDFIGSIDNVSVKEVGQNWTLGSDWSIGDGVAIASGSSFSALYPSTAIQINSGSIYKIKFDLNFVSGSLRTRIGGAQTSYLPYDVGFNSVELYLTAINTGNLSFVSGNLNGSIDNISVIEITDDTDLPRIDYTDGCGSLLLEPQTTQLVTYSEDFSQYSTGNSPIISGGFLSPDGTNNAYKITNTGSSTLYLSGLNLSSTSVRSIYARTVSGTGTAVLTSYFGNTNNLFTLTEQWQRFELTGTDSLSGVGNFYAADFRGSGTLTEYLIWGANATNDQDYVTSYIPTNGSTVTRNADLCNNAGSSDLINSTEGVLYAEIAALANDGTVRRISITDGTGNNRMNISYHPSTNYIQSFGFVNGALQFNFTLQITPSTTSFNKIAVKFKENDAALWLNGVEIATDNSVNTWANNTLNDLSFANNPSSGAESFYGNVKSVVVFKEALTNDELEGLTGEGYDTFNALALANNYTII